MKEFEMVKKGYNPVEVDKYVENLEEIIQSYKEKDSAIKNAILSAQVAADTIVLNAKKEAEELKRTTVNQLQDIRNSIIVQKEMLNSFQTEYQEMVKKYLFAFDSKDMNIVSQKINNLETYFDKLEKETTKTQEN